MRPALSQANAWVHGAGHGPMRSVALTNYDGNASQNTLAPLAAAFNLTLRCCDQDSHPALGPGAATPRRPMVLGCSYITDASITTTAPAGSANPTTAPLELGLWKTVAGDCVALHTTVPAGTIVSELGVVAFGMRGERGLRAAAAEARKWLERLRIACRTKGLGASRAYYGRVLQGAVAAVAAVQGNTLTPALLSTGEATLSTLATQLEGQVANITEFLSLKSAALRAEAVAAGERAALAIAASPAAPAGSKWKPLGATAVFSASVGYGWTQTSVGQLRVDSAEPLNDTLHASFIGGGPGLGPVGPRAGPGAGTLRVDLPASITTTGVVTLITGAFDTRSVGTQA